jgi:uncharacterized protein YidB (DUF937 family)
MEISDLVKMGATMFIKSKLSGDNGSGLDLDSLISAISGLASGANSDSSDNSSSDQSGGFDVSSILEKMKSGDLAGMAASWLGDGDNDNISSSQITEVFGQDKISDFASKLGLSEDEAVGGLRDALPQMVDKASSGGSILDSIGGIEGAINLVSKIFGRSK